MILYNNSRDNIDNRRKSDISDKKEIVWANFFDKKNIVIKKILKGFFCKVDKWKDEKKMIKKSLCGGQNIIKYAWWKTICHDKMFWWKFL